MADFETLPVGTRAAMMQAAAQFRADESEWLEVAKKKMRNNHVTDQQVAENQAALYRSHAERIEALLNT